jgi:trans-aconitate 2-methyltransferase
MNAHDRWSPQQYRKFWTERRQPFDDLLALVRPVPGGRVLDLGCGDGELTVELHRRLGARETVGIDSSAAMLAEATHRGRTGDSTALRFELADLTTVEPDGSWDVVAANASLQWVPDHSQLLGRLQGALRPGGQLAVQIPANWDHPSHTVAVELGEPLGVPPAVGHHSVLAPERYAELLHELGFAEQIVRLQVYGHQLDRTAAVVDWMRGSLLTHYERALDAATFSGFLAEYRTRLLDALDDPTGDRPYFFAFKRILFWARRPVSAA